MPSGFLVLPSPLLGPDAYAPLVEALQRAGHRADVGTCPEPIRAERLVADWTRAALDLDTAVLVAHSNAGYLAPTVSDLLGGCRIVFMDAALPPPTGPTRLAPSEFREFLGTLADAEGRLPGWTRWWPAEEMDEVLPAPWFGFLDDRVPRTDLAYFDSEVDPPDGWSRGPAAYLAFGATYRAEVAFARASGWPVAELEGTHLHHLTHAAEVAAAIEGLVGGPVNP